MGVRWNCGLDGAQNEMSQAWNSIPLSGAGIAAAVREQGGGGSAPEALHG